MEGKEGRKGRGCSMYGRGCSIMVDDARFGRDLRIQGSQGRVEWTEAEGHIWGGEGSEYRVSRCNVPNR